MESIKCLIVGGGPAGYTAAIYASRADLAPVVYEGVQPGGQLTTTTDIENYPGFENGIAGPELMSVMRAQAVRLGADVRTGAVTEADLSKRPFRIVIDGSHEIEAESLIIATGATAKYLGLPSEVKYRGLGVSACATCDGFFYRKKTVAVVGGGDTACEEATYLAGICKKVTVLEFMDTLKADLVMQDKAKSLPNVEILTSTQTMQVIGNGEKVTALRLKNRTTDAEHNLPLDGVFVQIGLSANSQPFDELEKSRIGEIIIDTHCRTSIPGVYAAGDVSSVPYKQIIISMGEGAKAALSAFDDKVRGVI